MSDGSGREQGLVELVNADGEVAGSATVASAHASPGLLHRAFSVLLFDEAGRMLLQQRSAEKTRFALRWANACCGHPAPGADPVVAGAARLAEELGLAKVGLTAVGVYVYQASDASTGRVEREYDHVLVGQLPADTPLHPDPREVAEVAWRSVAELRSDLMNDPASYAPWLAGVLGVWHDHIATGTTGGR